MGWGSEHREKGWELRARGLAMGRGADRVNVHRFQYAAFSPYFLLFPTFQFKGREAQSQKLVKRDLNQFASQMPVTARSQCCFGFLCGGARGQAHG